MTANMALLGQIMPLNLMTFYNSVTALVNEGGVTDVVYVDLCKEFAQFQYLTTGETWI